MNLQQFLRNRIHIFCILVLGFSGSHNLTSQAFEEIQKLYGGDPGIGEIFGYNLCIEDSTAVIGSPFDQNQFGSASIFYRTDSGFWDLHLLLMPSDANDQNEFGYSVDVSGDNIVTGTFLGSNGGAAYVFNRDNGGTDNWGEVKKLDGSNAGFENSFGVAVSIDREIIAVSEPFAAIGPNQNAGQVFVFSKNQGGVENWGLVTTLTADVPTANEQFGREISVSGDVLAIGSRNPSTIKKHVTIHSRDTGGVNTWGRVTGFDLPNGPDFNYDGKGLDLDGDYLVVGNPTEGNGAAYIFCKDCGGPDNWGLEKRIQPAGLQTTFFASTVAIHGDLAIAGAIQDNSNSSGAAYIFQRDLGGTGNWGLLNKISASDGENLDDFGSDVAINNGVALIGALADDDEGQNAGAAYIFGDPCNILVDSLNQVTLEIEQDNLFLGSPGINGIILKDVSGICWKVTVETSGQLVTCQVVCPDN